MNATDNWLDGTDVEEVAPANPCPSNLCTYPLDGGRPHAAHPGVLCADPYCMCDRAELDAQYPPDDESRSRVR